MFIFTFTDSLYLLQSNLLTILINVLSYLVNIKAEAHTQTLCDVTGLFVVTSFMAFGSFGTARGAIAFGAAGIGLAVADVPVGVVACVPMADFVPRLADGMWPVTEVVAAAVAFDAFWSVFSLLGILLTRDRRWLAASDVAATVPTVTMSMSVANLHYAISGSISIAQDMYCYHFATTSKSSTAVRLITKLSKTHDSNIKGPTP